MNVTISQTLTKLNDLTRHQLSLTNGMTSSMPDVDRVQETLPLNRNNQCHRDEHLRELDHLMNLQNSHSDCNHQGYGDDVTMWSDRHVGVEMLSCCDSQHQQQ